ncbi:unnamed protein product [Ectocarpus fasciculatus]
MPRCSKTLKPQQNTSSSKPLGTAGFGLQTTPTHMCPKLQRIDSFLTSCAVGDLYVDYFRQHLHQYSSSSHGIYQSFAPAVQVDGASLASCPAIPLILHAELFLGSERDKKCFSSIFYMKILFLTPWCLTYRKVASHRTVRSYRTVPE